MLSQSRPRKIIHSLKFQITAILLILLSLFSFAISYTLYAIDERESEMVALHLIHRLQLITSYMDMQSMNYLKNIPQESYAYKSDINLYYDDLTGQINDKNEIIHCFSDEHLTPALTNMKNDIDLDLNLKTKNALMELKETWMRYYQELNAILGTRDDAFKLAEAAQYVSAHKKIIRAKENSVIQQLQFDLKQRINWINHINKVVLAIAFIISLSTLLGFYLKVIIPLNRAVEGFNKVAKGDFGHQIILSTDNEISSIVNSFNHLSQRLNSIFKLIHRVQQGDNLDETLGFIAEQFATILPINWTSVLLHNGHASLLELQKVYVDGQSHALPRTLFSIEGSMLGKAISKDKPLLISDLQQMAEQNKEYVFLQLLVEEGMKSAIFLHLTQATQVLGLLIFASRQHNAYNNEHLELLNNIAHLVTHSFGKTIKMAEQKRLAAIGEFTSAIVHEVRNPLTTIGLSLNYFKRLDLDEDGREWGEIAGREVRRMGRLLEDILLYSKPLHLNLNHINILNFIKEFIHSHHLLLEEKSLNFELHAFEQENQQIHKVLFIKGDHDRLKQILLNIYRNAIEAADKGSTINYILTTNPEAHTLDIIINNQGSVIPKEIIERIGEPFFTTKTCGTGLGMGIVKRMVEAHSGYLSIYSSIKNGTDVMITLPYFELGYAKSQRYGK